MPLVRDTADRFADELISFIEADVSLGGEPVRPSTDLVMTGLVDSLGVVKIVAWIERRLGIAIDATDVVVENFGSVEAMVEYVRGLGGDPAG